MEENQEIRPCAFPSCEEEEKKKNSEPTGQTLFFYFRSPKNRQSFPRRPSLFMFKEGRGFSIALQMITLSSFCHFGFVYVSKIPWRPGRSKENEILLSVFSLPTTAPRRALPTSIRPEVPRWYSVYRCSPLSLESTDTIPTLVNPPSL